MLPAAQSSGVPVSEAWLHALPRGLLTPKPRYWPTNWLDAQHVPSRFLGQGVTFCNSVLTFAVPFCSHLLEVASISSAAFHCETRKPLALELSYSLGSHARVWKAEKPCFCSPGHLPTPPPVSGVLWSQAGHQGYDDSLEG